LAKIPPGVGPRYPQVVVLVGATGDLSQRKLLPGLFHLCSAGFIPSCRIIGVSLDEIDVEGFRAIARGAIDKFSDRKDGDWAAFSAILDYVPMSAGPPALKAAVETAEREVGGESRRVHYLSVPPNAALPAVRMIAEAELVEHSRVIMEKPFGTDLASAKFLNARLHEVFSEEQIFRIDHFLGKEPAQNILAFRFANGLFEPVWNRQHIRYVQIDVPEALSIEGRAAFYDATGAYRDMVVTHLFQVLGFVAMEPPVSLSAGPLGDEKVKVFEALKPLNVRHVVRGQYAGYRSEPGVAADSDTETMVAVRAAVDNWRWQGVPFFLRSGKAMGTSRQVITLGFHRPPLRMFRAQLPDAVRQFNEIVIDFADPGSISIEFLVKVPGPELSLGRTKMTFSYENSFATVHALEGYERLILLAMIGDQSLFTSSHGVERLWEISAPLLDNPPPVKPYNPGSWGPPSVDSLISPFHWHLPESGTPGKRL
jgi:glucose-6-phosphate 1-dehydrogenase